MSGISINSSIAALRALNRLSSSTALLNRSLERLSSGARINRASDDAAGLAISSLLRADTRVYSQGIRNFSDGISALSIAEGGLRELTGIGIRIRELAEQAANGTYSLTQRRSLNAEANSLVSEFNRIIGTTEFNGQKLLNLSVRDLRLQGGYGVNGSIGVGIGASLKRNAGNGTFGTPSSVSTASGGTGPFGSAVGDFNGDGNADIATANAFTDGVTVKFGDGQGNFSSTTDLTAGTDPSDIVAGDFNGDGRSDIAVLNQGSNDITVRLSAGGGSFGAATTYSLNGDVDSDNNLVVGDFNGDGRVDLAAGAGDRVNVILGTGTGSFGSTLVATSGHSNLQRIAAGDFDGNGTSDLVAATAGNAVTVLSSGGGGNFSSSTVSGLAGGVYGLAAADLNNDGLDDIVVSSLNYVQTSLSQGSGGFGAVSTFNGPAAVSLVTAGDVDGDGYADILVTDTANSSIQVYHGNGNGSLSLIGSRAGASSWFANDIELADFNKDGILDIAQANNSANNLGIFIGNGGETTQIAAVNLNTQSSARSVLDSMNAILDRISRELGDIGANQSRLNTGIANLGAATENYAAAASRITDVDVASESAELVRQQILTQVSAVVLSQAKLIPEIALSLLRA